MSDKKICPQCGSDMFMATITRGGVIQVSASPDNPEENIIQIIKEIQDRHDVAIVKCARCRAQIGMQDLIVSVKCKTCGEETSPADVDENGNCGVCSALAAQTELANASQRDLIRMLVEEQRKISALTERINKKEELAKKTDEELSVKMANVPIEEELTEGIEEEASEITPAEEVAVKKTRKRKNVKKAEAEAIPEEENISTEEETLEVSTDIIVAESEEAEAITAEVDNIADQQEAPFPDIPEQTTAPVESENLEDVLPGFSSSPEAQSAEEPSEKFEMFDDTEDVI